MSIPQLFSVVIPARNEEKRIDKCLDAVESSLQKSSFSYEIIVVINRCTDRTESVARKRGCIIVQSDQKNLAAIRNSGAKVARGKFLVTIDADSIVSLNMFTHIERELTKEDVIGGGVMIYPERWSLGIFATGLMLLPIALWHRISCGLFFCRKKDFDAIGGFNEELCSVEDIDFAKRLKKYGAKSGKRFVTLFRSWIITSTRKFDAFGDWYFVLRPWLFVRLLKGKDQDLSNKVWYDFKN